RRLIGPLQRSGIVEEQSWDTRLIQMLGAVDERAVDGGRLDQRMAADRHEAAAYARDIGRRVEHEQLTQGVDEHYLRIWPDGLLARTGRETNSPLTQRVGNCR